MTAKKYPRTYAVAAKPVPDNWAQRNILLTVPEVMFITQRSYYAILGLVYVKKLHPVLGSKPYRFAPSEVLRVFFPAPVESPPSSLKTEGLAKSAGKQSKPPREVFAWQQ